MVVGTRPSRGTRAGPGGQQRSRSREGTDFDQTYRMRRPTAGGHGCETRSGPSGTRTARSCTGRASWWESRERVETEERLREAEARYRAMVERIPAVTYTDHVGADGVTMMGFVSPQMEEILGYPPQRVPRPCGPVVRAHAPRRPRASPSDRCVQQLGPRTVRARVPDAPCRRALGVGPRHLDGGLRRAGQPGLLPRLPHRRELPPRRRGAAARGRAHVPDVGRAEPGGLLHPEHRPRRSDEIAHRVHRARRRGADRRPDRADDRRPRALADDDPSRRSGTGVRRGRARATRTARTPSASNTGWSARTEASCGSSTRRRSSGRRVDAPYWQGFQLDITARKRGGAAPAGRPRAPSPDGGLLAGRRRQHGRRRPHHRRGTRRRRRRSAGAPRR